MAEVLLNITIASYQWELGNAKTYRLIKQAEQNFMTGCMWSGGCKACIALRLTQVSCMPV